MFFHDWKVYPRGSHELSRKSLCVPLATGPFTREQVAKINKLQGLAAKTLKDKILKNFLSVFRDWKVYPRGSRELSRKNLCVPLATRPFTREQVAKINTRSRGCIMRLGWPAIESQKQGNTVFEIFQFL